MQIPTPISRLPGRTPEAIIRPKFERSNDSTDFFSVVQLKRSSQRATKSSGNSSSAVSPFHLQEPRTPSHRSLTTRRKLKTTYSDSAQPGRLQSAISNRGSTVYSPGSSRDSSAYPKQGGIDPPRDARSGYEWVWFPEGYWAERPVVEISFPTDSKEKRCFRT